MAQAIMPALMIGGGLLSASGQMTAANAKAAELRYEADQLDVQAGLKRATSQRQAIDEKRQATLALSRGLAVSAASGGGADDPTVVNALSGIAGEGEYRALTQLYNGEETARGMEAEAAAKRRGASSTQSAGRLSALGTVLSTGASVYDRYGGK